MERTCISERSLGSDQTPSNTGPSLSLSEPSLANYHFAGLLGECRDDMVLGEMLNRYLVICCLLWKDNSTGGWAERAKCRKANAGAEAGRQQNKEWAHIWGTCKRAA